MKQNITTQQQKYLYQLEMSIDFEPLTRLWLPSDFSMASYITHEQLTKLIDILGLPIDKNKLLKDRNENNQSKPA